MATFKDTNGRSWTLSLDGPKIKRIRDACGIDLGAIDGKAYERMDADPTLLVDVLWLLCEKEAKEAGVTDEQFGMALVGDAIDEATEAVLDAITDFFPKRRRELLKALAAQNKATSNAAMNSLMAKIGDPELVKKIQATMEANLDAEIKRVLTQLSPATNSADSSESPQKGEPSAS